MRKLATAIALTGIMLTTGCATTPNTDDTLTTQMETMNIPVDGVSDAVMQTTVNAVCTGRENGRSHEFIMDATRIELGHLWSDKEAERFIQLAYMNRCPVYSK